jgi:hypothetical protein
MLPRGVGGRSGEYRDKRRGGQSECGLCAYGFLGPQKLPYLVSRRVQRGAELIVSSAGAVAVDPVVVVRIERV